MPPAWPLTAAAIARARSRSGVSMATKIGLHAAASSASAAGSRDRGPARLALERFEPPAQASTAGRA